MVLTIDNVEELVASGLVSVHNSEHVLLDLSIGNVTLKWAILSLKSGSDVLSDLGEVKDLAVGAVSDHLGNE